MSCGCVIFFFNSPGVPEAVAIDRRAALRRAAVHWHLVRVEDEVTERAMLVTKRAGGRGAVREVTDLILKAKGLWDEATKAYLEA